MKGQILDIKEKLIDLAVEQWVRMLKNPNHENGDPSSTGMMCRVFDMALKDKLVDETSDDKFEIFREKLKEILMEAPNPRNVYMDVDYHPSECLANAAKEAGLNCNLFPIKTYVEIMDDSVLVSEGYSDRGRKIFPEKDD